ncbi:MAG: cysteine desulfurase-like protein [Blastocatellia bacterium]
MKEAKELTGIASVEEIRAHFPALERHHNGYPVAYFDGPGGTQVPRPVVEAMSDYLYHHNANTHWAYPTSAETDALIESARVALADFFNADSTEIAFGLNMTTLTFHLARALGYTFSAGDEVVVTELDHHGNVAPWHQLTKERGVEIRTVKMDTATGQLDWPTFEQCVTPRTKLVAVGAASNALGTINDVARAVRMARQVGALVFVDAVHYAPHELVDVRAMDCDFLACSAYKFYGPHIGVMYGKRELLEALDFPRLLPAPDYAPDRAETGTQNHEGMVGAAAAVDFLASLAAGGTRRERLQSAFAGLHERGVRLLTKLWKGLATIEGVNLYGPPPAAPRTPTVSFTLAGQPSLAVAEFLAEHGLFASNGDFYAWTVVERLGLAEEGLLRIGCACYTTDEEIDRLLEAVRELARGTPR